MSELATEMSNSDHLVADLEFLGPDFAARRQALQKVEAYRKVTRLALADAVEAMTGRSVLMTFRPSRAITKDYPRVVTPVYALDDEEREPMTEQVTIYDVDVKQFQATVGAGEIVEGRHELMWYVGLSQILEIAEPETPPSNG
jgi:hypothetical protein